MRTAETLGRLGAPIPFAELKSTRWDAIVVGAGHNGLSCAAYLARAGRQVLVLESRERVGGACTIEETWPGVRVSPCAYLLGLLHPRVIKELGLCERGLKWITADAGLFVPFDDGSSIQLWDDDQRCEAEIAALNPRDVSGWRAFSDVKRRLRDALRPANHEDVWLRRAPSRAWLEQKLGRDREAINLLFNWSMVDYVERFFHEERLQMAYLGQGVIGTNASPADSGTASIHFHHQSGRLGGVPGSWGYVQGGIGMVSFLLCDAAREAGAVIATGIPVAAIEPGRGVRLSCGNLIESATIVSNADPRTTLNLLGDQAESGWKTRVEQIPMVGCTMKVNLLLRDLPDFLARPGTDESHHRGQINTPLNKRDWDIGHREARSGSLPQRLWTELYMQTVHDRSVAPEGLHTMSVFAQYVPHTFKQGNWESRRAAAGQAAINSISRFCTNLPDAIVDFNVLGPPDIEKKVGLHGGHIFQGECLPDFMWDRRLDYRTPMPGLFMCGACTYPGGSVIGVNGRNAALDVLGQLDSP